jgi:hypothetical protein
MGNDVLILTHHELDIKTVCENICEPRVKNEAQHLMLPGFMSLDAAFHLPSQNESQTSVTPFIRNMCNVLDLLEITGSSVISRRRIKCSGNATPDNPRQDGCD